MRILLTGDSGYIGPVMTRMMKEESFEVVGLDVGYFDECDFFERNALPARHISKDIRNVAREDLEGVDAVVHLAGLSNDPLGELNPALTDDINHLSTIRLAELAKEMGAKRFVFASSCSMYGIADTDGPLTEEGKLNPITAYAKAKTGSEKGLSLLADDDFHPVYMRNATVYGISPRLRLDLVVNNLTAYAYLMGEIRILSDGTPWRPIVHIEDFCAAFIAALKAPAGKVHDQAFNVGLNEENFQVKDIAEEVKKIVPGCVVRVMNETGSDERSYRVDFTKIKDTLDFKPKWNLVKGIEQLYSSYRENNLTMEDFESASYFRVRTLRSLLEAGQLDSGLHWQ
jgi:nucleoside-diphosphate-sugar epimerase